MELQFFGANCLKITAKKASIVIDDNLAQLGLKSVTKPDDISLRTLESFPAQKARFETHMPGEYEISGVSIHGIAARSHMDEEGKNSATIYIISAGGVKVVILGHIHPDLAEDQIGQIGMVDIAVVPVGGNGFTLDGVGALKVVKEIEPKVVIPTHYADKAIKYEVPQAELAEALKNMGMESAETVDKYKFKPAELSDSTKVVVLERS